VNRLIRAVIDTHALRHNLRTIGSAPAERRVMASSSHAYGHGLIPTAPGARGKADHSRSRGSRKGWPPAAGITQPIVLLEGVFAPPSICWKLRATGFDLVVHDPLQVELLEEYSGAARFLIWIKIDTGMNRLGFRPRNFPMPWPAFPRRRAPLLEIRLRLTWRAQTRAMTTMTREQLGAFQERDAGLDYAVSMRTQRGFSPRSARL